MPCVLVLAACAGTFGGDESRREPPEGEATEPDDGPPRVIPTETSECSSPEESFLWETYAPIFSRCLGCHNAFGLAGQLGLDYQLEFPGLADFAAHNTAVLTSVAARTVETDEGDVSILLAKPTGMVGHVGGQVIAPGSDEAKLLESYIKKLADPPSCDTAPVDGAAKLVAAIEVDSFRTTFARASLALTGTVATPEELDAMDDTEGALTARLDTILTSEPFRRRLADYFADALKVRAESSIMHPYSQGPYLYRSGYKQLRFFNQLCQGEARNPCCHAETQECCYEYYPAEYCEDSHGGDGRRGTTDGLVEEPLELIKYVAREGKPITEILTADHTMVNPWSAGIFGFSQAERDELFDDDLDNDRWEYVPAKVPANGANELPAAHDGSATYPHSGILSTSGLLNRWYSTKSNVHRSRAARVVLTELLAVPILKFSDFNTNVVPAGADLETATQLYPACTACHAAIDPIAGHFRFHPNGGGYTDVEKRISLPEHVPSPSFLGETLPAGADPIRFLSERVARHDRFPLAMTETILEGLVGVTVLGVPASNIDPAFEAKTLAFRIQQQLLAEVLAALPSDRSLTFRDIVRAVVGSRFFRARSVKGELTATEREALALAGVGGRKMITPEQLTRKLQDVTGVGPADEPNARGDVITASNKFLMLLGGTNWDTVPDRDRIPNPVSVRLLERVANDFACRAIVRDLSFPDGSARQLLKSSGITTVPEGDGIAPIQADIRRLHRYLLGEDLPAGSSELEATYELFIDARNAALTFTEDGGTTRLSCRSTTTEEGRVAVDKDPDGVARAWIAVVAYLLSDARFAME